MIQTLLETCENLLIALGEYGAHSRQCGARHSAGKIDCVCGLDGIIKRAQAAIGILYPDSGPFTTAHINTEVCCRACGRRGVVTQVGPQKNSASTEPDVTISPLLEQGHRVRSSGWTWNRNDNPESQAAMERKVT